MALSTVSKVLAGTVFAGGLVFAGITFTGDQDITDIKGNVNSLKDKLNTAIEDNAWMSSQFKTLQGLYGSAVSEANSTIKGLTGAKAELESQKEELTSQVNTLTGQLSDKEAQLQSVLSDATASEQDKADAQAELQSEITRLEQSLAEANEKIAELAKYVAEADASVQYEAINKEEYTVEAKDVMDADTTVAPVETPEATEPINTDTNPATDTESTPEATPEAVPEPESFISAEATALNDKVATYLADSKKIADQEEGYRGIYRATLEITGVTTYKDKYLAYKVKPLDTSVIASPAPTAMKNVIMDAGVYEVYYIDETTGTPYFKVDRNGMLTKLN